MENAISGATQIKQEMTKNLWRSFNKRRIFYYERYAVNRIRKIAQNNLDVSTKACNFLYKSVTLLSHTQSLTEKNRSNIINQLTSNISNAIRILQGVLQRSGNEKTLIKEIYDDQLAIRYTIPELPKVVVELENEVKVIEDLRQKRLVRITIPELDKIKIQVQDINRQIINIIKAETSGMIRIKTALQELESAFTHSQSMPANCIARLTKIHQLCEEMKNGGSVRIEDIKQGLTQIIHLIHGPYKNSNEIVILRSEQINKDGYNVYRLILQERRVELSTRKVLRYWIEKGNRL